LAFAASSASLRFLSSSDLPHLNFLRYTASSLWASVILTLQKRCILGCLEMISATSTLKLEQAYSTGLFRMLMSRQFGFLSSFSTTSKLVILFALRFKYSSYSRGASSSSCTLSILLRRRCSFFNAGIPSQPPRTVTALLAI